MRFITKVLLCVDQRFSKIRSQMLKTTTYPSLNQGPTHLTPTSLTTESLLSWLITSLTSCFINENSAYNFTDLSMEVLEHSVYVLLEIVHSIRAVQ